MDVKLRWKAHVKKKTQRAWAKTQEHTLYWPMGRSALSIHNKLMLYGKGKSAPLQAWTGPEGSRKLRFPDFVTTAQDGGRLSALSTGRFLPP